MNLNISSSVKNSSNPGKSFVTFLCLFVILFIAFYIRASRVAHLEPNATIGFDGERYDEIATNLLHKQRFGQNPNQPYSWRPPGYPFFLYAVYSLFGHNIYAARMAQCYVGTALCFILFILTKRLTRTLIHSNKIALLAAFLYAINFYSIFITQTLFTETFNSFLITLAIYFFYLAHDSQKGKFYLFSFLASWLLWYSALTRPATILYWAWVGLWFSYENRNNKKRILQALAVVLVSFCLTILPWTIRNYNLHKKFLLISSNGGFMFFMSHHPLSVGGFIKEPHTPQQLEELQKLDEIGRQKKYYQYAFDWIRENPQKELALILAKQLRLWSTVEDLENPSVYFNFITSTTLLPLLTFHFLLAWAVPGLLILSRHLRHFLLLIFYLLNHAMIISLFYIYDGARMRAEMLPALTIFAAIGIVYLCQWPSLLKTEIQN